MLGIHKARETVNRKITVPVSKALIISCLAFLVSLVALILAVTVNAN